MNGRVPACMLLSHSERAPSPDHVDANVQVPNSLGNLSALVTLTLVSSLPAALAFM